ATRSRASRQSISFGTRRMSSWSRGLRDSRSAPPPVLPHLLTNQAVDPRLLLSHRDNGTRGCPAGHFKQKLGADGFLELITVLDRHHERAGTADHAVFVVPVEIFDIHGRV